MQNIKIAFIVNQSRKLTRAVQEVIDLCQQEKSFDSEFFYTQKQNDASQFAYDCAKKQFDFIVAIGGDGTVNEVVNGMCKVPETNSALAVLPNGTGNDFFKSAQLKRQPQLFVEALRNKTTKPLDIAKVEFSNKTVYFANIADVGFGGRVVEILNEQRKYIGGKASYALAILRAFIGYRKPRLEITTSEYHFEGPVLLVAICNGSIFGNGLTINPFAKVDDGMLNITLLGNVTLFDYVRNLKKLKLGQVIDHPEAHYLKTDRVTIKLKSGKAVAELDGEYFPEGECTISLIKHALKLVH
jgi:YegS/Rv2252/BmrU family lipid kinase